MTTPERPVDWTYGVGQPATGQPHDPYAPPASQPYAQPDQAYAQPPAGQLVDPITGQAYAQPVEQAYGQPAAGQPVQAAGVPYAQPAGQAYEQQPYVEPPIAGLPYNGPAPVEQQPYYPPAPAATPYQPMPYQPMPYGYPQQGPYQHLQTQATNGMAIASMVLGILWLYWVGSILALIFGYVARDQIKRTGQSGDGMAIAGIVLGWVGIGFLLIGLVAWGSVWL